MPKMDSYPSRADYYAALDAHFARKLGLDDDAPENDCE